MYTLNRPLVLASQSPRRSDLLKQFGFDFEVLPSFASEKTAASLSPAKKVVLLAKRKAEATGTQTQNSIVLGFDTIVYHKGKVLEKPNSEREAFRMLSALSGHTHIVYTGIALLLLPENRLTTAYERTTVQFRQLEEAEIKSYIESGEPFDKAGSYGIQGLGGSFVSQVNGCFFNVVGLPITLLLGMLKPYRMTK